ncbi:hypothetical protein C8J56DRAFT_1045182 [Mycena floridula]|nr:hypothetical protein C8J56DRAFT_1045182 [Mycena floridula]
MLISNDFSIANPHVLQVLLSIAAVISMALGFFQDFGTKRVDNQPLVDWVEGVAIIAAILIVAGVDAAVLGLRTVPSTGTAVQMTVKNGYGSR